VVNKIAAYTVETTVDGNARVIENLSTLIEPVQKLAVKLLMAAEHSVIVNRYGSERYLLCRGASR
jgi:hypothetical protein